MNSALHPAEPDVLLDIRNLVVGWSGQGILPPVSMQVRRGRLCAVVGQNGSGKSTWMKTVLGLASPIAGTIARAPGLRISHIEQALSLDPLLPVRAMDVVQWGTLHGWQSLNPRRLFEGRQTAMHALERVDAADIARRPVHELSGGQRQRVVFARMLASNTDLALLDEPTAAMDLAAERQALRLLRELARSEHMGIVIITHALRMALDVADDILLLDRKCGEIVFDSVANIRTNPTFMHHAEHMAADHAEEA